MSWEYVNLGDIATFVNGFPFKPSDWSTEGMEIIRIQNLTKGSSETNYFKGVIPEKYKIIKGDILISWSATLDIFVWDGDDAWLNQHIFKVVFDKINIDRQFFIYLIKHILEDMRREVHGATMQHITKGRFDSLQVPLPPLPIQKRIAEILDAADTLKRKDQELLKKYDELAQAIFIEMFGDPFNNSSDSSNVVNFEKVTKLLTYGFTRPMKHFNKGIPILTVKNIQKGFIDFINVHYASQLEFNELTAKCKPNNGDILITKDGSIGRTALLETDEMVCINQSVALIKPNLLLVEPKFLVAYLNLNSVQDKILNMGKGGGLKHLQITELAKFPLSLPDLTLQRLFVQRIDKLIENKTKTNLQNELGYFLFESLIQKAFNGELVN